MTNGNGSKRVTPAPRQPFKSQLNADNLLDGALYQDMVAQPLKSAERKIFDHAPVSQFTSLEQFALCVAAGIPIEAGRNSDGDPSLRTRHPCSLLWYDNKLHILEHRPNTDPRPVAKLDPRNVKPEPGHPGHPGDRPL